MCNKCGNHSCHNNGHHNNCYKPNTCAPKCDPCNSQERLLYCGKDIECLGVEKGNELTRVMETFGETICQIQQTLSTDAHIVVTAISAGVVCEFGGVRIDVVEDLTNTVISTNNICNGGESEPFFIEVTYAEAETLISDEELIEGVTYSITDKGIFVQALANNILSSVGERTMRIVKSAYYTPATGIMGVWYSSLNPAINDVAVWGGKVWRSLTGNIGSADDDITLDSTNWVLIPITNDTYYTSKTFGCVYDFTHDWVSEQWDERGNIMSFDWYLNNNSLGSSFNFIDITDWGNPSIFNNNCFGIYNNSNETLIYSNKLQGEIAKNSNAGDIYYNSCRNIRDNTNTGYIHNNSNQGELQNNSNVGNIADNTCIGIYDNTNEGSIERNSNTSTINANSNVGSITYNSNLGSISENLNTSLITLNTNLGDINDNSNDGQIASNSNKGAIYSNSNDGEISSNSNESEIASNTNNGAIKNNSCIADIAENDNDGFIVNNSNLGRLAVNTNGGDIANNLNNGSISNNLNTGDIQYNRNNGDISNIGAANSNIQNNVNNGYIMSTTTGNISDTIVNK